MKIDVKTKLNTQRVKRKVDEGTFRSLAHAGAAVRLIARRNIRQRKTASPPGQPPHTRRGQLRRAILYAVDRKSKSVVIGPSINLISKIGRAHEHGGVEYPAKTRKPNWRIQIGGHGPIPNPRGKIQLAKYTASFIKILTPAQLEKVQQFVTELPPQIKLTQVPPRRAVYPKRPFMRPALEKLRTRLPTFWRTSVY